MHISWNLVADIGGTNARFAAYLVDQPEVLYEFHHAVNEYPQFDQVLGVLTTEIEQMCGWRCPPEQVCFAVACPVDNEIIRFTNSHWAFSRDQLMNCLNCSKVILIN